MRRCDGRPPLLDHFSALRDQRQVCKVIYPLPEILLIVLYGVLAGGGEDFAEIRRWAERKIDLLRRVLPFDRGLPRTTR